MKNKKITAQKNLTGTDWCRITWLLRRGLSCVLLVFLFFAFEPALTQNGKIGLNAQVTTTEYELKAVYLYNFLNFFTWPVQNTPTGEEKTYVIGVVGSSPFGASLEVLRKNLLASGRKAISIVYFDPYHADDRLDKCNLLFVSASEQKNAKNIMAALKGKPVLTVSDQDWFLDSGGMINLIQHEGKIRWEVNRRSIEESGLLISVKLLSIAVNVVD